jgi:hypothetical protein
VSSAKKYLRPCVAFISSLAIGLSIGASWLLLGNGDAYELLAASAIVAVSIPFQFLRKRMPHSVRPPPDLGDDRRERLLTEQVKP